MITFFQFIQLTLILFLVFLVIDEHLKPGRPETHTLCVVMSEKMTITSAMQAAAALGWEVKRRGREIYFRDGLELRHSAVLVGI